MKYFREFVTLFIDQMSNKKKIISLDGGLGGLEPKSEFAITIQFFFAYTILREASY